MARRVSALCRNTWPPEIYVCISKGDYPTFHPWQKRCRTTHPRCAQMAETHTHAAGTSTTFASPARLDVFLWSPCTMAGRARIAPPLPAMEMGWRWEWDEGWMWMGWHGMGRDRNGKGIGWHGMGRDKDGLGWDEVAAEDGGDRNRGSSGSRRDLPSFAGMQVGVCATAHKAAAPHQCGQLSSCAEENFLPDSCILSAEAIPAGGTWRFISWPGLQRFPISGASAQYCPSSVARTREH